MIYAGKRDTGEARSYRLDRIPSVRNANSALVPRYAIELTAGVSGAISPLSMGASIGGIDGILRPAESSSRRYQMIK
jgi:hypothetical protein